NVQAPCAEIASDQGTDEPIHRTGGGAKKKEDPKQSRHVRLTVKLRGRATTPDERRGRTLSSRARGAKPLTHHGPLQRLLEHTRTPSWCACVVDATSLDVLPFVPGA